MTPATLLANRLRGDASYLERLVKDAEADPKPGGRWILLTLDAARDLANGQRLAAEAIEEAEQPGRKTA